MVGTDVGWEKSAVTTGRAEIDIIARRRSLMIFVEVKRRPNIDIAWEAITPAQSIRLRRAAENFIRVWNQ